MSAVAGPLKADLHCLLVALIKIALADDAPSINSWRETAVAAEARVTQGLGETPIDPGRLDSIWTAAVKEAETDPMVRRDETVNPVLPALCPLQLGDLMGAGFDVDRAADAIRATASFG